MWLANEWKDYKLVDSADGEKLELIDTHVAKCHPNMEAHASTQMGIDDLEGTLLLKEAGAKRVVLSREVPIEAVKHIRKTADIPIVIATSTVICYTLSNR